MKHLQIAFVTAALAFSVHADAAHVASTKIKSILVGKNYGNRAFIELSVKPTAPVSCNTNPDYSFVFDPTTEVGKVTMSVVLAAYAAQRDVWVSGYDTCDIFPNVESLKEVWAK